MKKINLNSLIAFSLLFTSLVGFSQNEGGKVIDGIVATVGDKIVLKSEIENQITSLKAQGVIIDDAAKCQLFEEVLFQKLLLNQAAIDSVEVTEAQVESEMNRRLNYFISQVGSEQRLEQYYKKSMIEIKNEFRVIVEEQLIVQMMQGNITGGVKVTPEEVKNFYKGLPEDSIPTVNSEVEVAQILINAKESDAAKNQARERLNGIRERIINGEQFSTLAVLYSEDEGSAKKGGELGFLGRADLVPEYSTTAFKLKNSTVSEIVESQFGFHIIQLIERRGQKINTRHILIKVQVEEEQILLAKQKADSIYNLITTDTLTFGELAFKYSDDKQTKNSDGLMVSPQTGTSILDIEQVDPQIFYIIDNMKPGEISKPVPAESFDGKKGYRIIKLLSKTEPHKAKFETDYARIQEAALAGKQNEANQKWIKDKIKTTFIKIDDEYMNCSFDNNWSN
ncbi:peptidylprolyl isomerase [Vicingus serpentipes]|uniref:Peptidylprolyl isomerase n=1 Tax=Vicingus serpentipes TaxID=1926625 RepID=A0A5C6RSN1_9FLAO|nr:peptidylprolyl isomerase [Vicingus serpentipes]TXB65456.1 peptidylprolyl isomerase [Vicingus serpentipes]